MVQLVGSLEPRKLGKKEVARLRGSVTLVIITGSIWSLSPFLASHTRSLVDMEWLRQSCLPNEATRQTQSEEDLRAPCCW